VTVEEEGDADGSVRWLVVVLVGSSRTGREAAVDSTIATRGEEKRNEASTLSFSFPLND